MTEHEITEAKSSDLRGSLAAMRRAAQMAREIAIQTNTEIILCENGKIVRITAEQLRAEEAGDA